ncbi:MAG: LysM peptidoglycan-binding domain-containing protein [Rhodanobacter sp.]
MGEQISKPDFSSVQSTVTSTPPAAKARAEFGKVESEVSSTVDESTNYIVQNGDNLSKIAKHFYGDADAWQAIFEVNRDQLTDPDRIKPGQILKIPPRA